MNSNSIQILNDHLSYFQSELWQAQQVNQQLRNDLMVVENGVNGAQRKLEDYNSMIQYTLDNCDGKMNSSHVRVIDSLEMQGEIEKLFERFKNIELANKKIRQCNNKKYYEFSNYRTVRKIVQGIMDNMDLNMISDQVIRKSVEVQHLQTPDYWLTCVLISIMAWKNNDKELAEKAILRACSLDKKHSAVFFMLFNLRMGREKAALMWFDAYQDSELKGEDQRTFLALFSLISKTITENVDEKIKDEIHSFIKKIIQRSIESEGLTENDMVNQIKWQYSRMEPDESIGYSMLRKCCSEFARLNRTMMKAKNNKNILQYILNIINVPVEQKNEFIKSYIDELVAHPNEKEEAVLLEIKYNDLIIRLEGDVEGAKSEFNKIRQEETDDLNLVKEIINWIFEKEFREVSGQVKLNMFTLIANLQKNAIESYVDDYRKERKSILPITIDEFSARIDFNLENDARNKIEKYYSEKKNTALSQIKNWKLILGFAISIVFAVGAIFAGPWLFGGTLVAAGFGGYAILSNSSKRKQITRKYNENIKRVTAQINEVVKEYNAYNDELSEYDSYSFEIFNELDKF